MTPEEYVKAIQDFSTRREYGPLLDFVDRFSHEVEDHLTADHVRTLRVLLKHADMVLSRTPSRVNTG